jgi:hypothetical protein
MLALTCAMKFSAMVNYMLHSHNGIMGDIKILLADAKTNETNNVVYPIIVSQIEKCNSKRKVKACVKHRYSLVYIQSN